MKNFSIVLSSIAIACLVSYYSFSQKQIKKPVVKQKGVSARPSTSGAKSSISKVDVEDGKNLVSKSDCLACHQLKVKVVGPAYSAVAARYPATDANINLLSDKIIKGGGGVWGPVAMTPHPAIAVADARKMVKYVLSLNGK